MPTRSRFEGLVLLIDDVEDNIEVYRQFLEFHGIRVLTAASGAEGLELAVNHLPSVIVLDLSMPGMDGLAVTRSLRSRAETKHIRIIVLTGHAFDESRRLAFEAGVDGYLVKPCLPDVLLAEIERGLRPGSR